MRTNPGTVATASTQGTELHTKSAARLAERYLSSARAANTMRANKFKTLQRKCELKLEMLKEEYKQQQIYLEKNIKFWLLKRI